MTPRNSRLTWLGIGSIAALGTWAVRDYRHWQALGPGGLPANPRGWATTTLLRLRGRNPFQVHADAGAPVNPAIGDLPPRAGTRPRVSHHPIPHRVLDQHPPEPLRHAAHELFDGFAAQSTVALEYRTSRWEKHNQALYVAAADGEIGHLHPSDASLHVTLAPADAQHLINLGWGQLHPLAGTAAGLPATYTLLYPPRTTDDLETLHTILTASVAYMTGAPNTREGNNHERHPSR